MQKSKYLCDLLEAEFAENVTIGKTDSPLFVKATVKTEKPLSALLKSCEKEGLRIIPVEEKNGEAEIAFSVSAISTEKMEKGIKLLKELSVGSE